MQPRVFFPLGVICISLASLSSAGCGSGSLPSPADAGQAREALRSALSAWKKGEKTDALANLSPAIHVSDVDWHDGYRLEKFEVYPKDQQKGLSLRCFATLDLKHPRGETVQKVVAYMIDTQSVIAIVREDP
jgi:hypothetical protein